MGGALGMERVPLASASRRFDGVEMVAFGCVDVALALWKSFSGAWRWSFIVGSLLLAGLLFMQFWGRLGRCFYSPRRDLSRLQWTRVHAGITLSNVISAGVGVLLVRVLLLIMSGWAADPVAGQWKALIFGPAALIQIFILVIVVQLGLLGSNFPDERREWWSRLGAWEQIYVMGWIALCGLAFYGPHFVAQLEAGLLQPRARAGWPHPLRA